MLGDKQPKIRPVPTDDKPRRHLNRAEKRALKAAELAKFVHAVGRPAQKGVEPNDRRGVDLSLQKKLRRVPPIELDRLLRDDEEN
jgi:hypothetical protein